MPGGAGGGARRVYCRRCCCGGGEGENRGDDVEDGAPRDGVEAPEGGEDAADPESLAMSEGDHDGNEAGGEGAVLGGDGAPPCSGGAAFGDADDGAGGGCWLGAV